MKRLPLAAVLASATLLSAAGTGLAAWQDTYAGTMCNSFLGNVGPNNGTEIVNGTANAILVDCPFRMLTGFNVPVCNGGGHQYVDFRGANNSSVSCSLRAMAPTGGGWNWAPCQVTNPTGYFEIDFCGLYLAQDPFAASFECVMQPYSAISNYRVYPC